MPPSVPCRRRYKVPKEFRVFSRDLAYDPTDYSKLCSSQNELIRLKVGQGNQMTDFKVHATILSDNSEYFRERIPDRKVFFFVHDHPGLFKTLLKFLYSGHLHHPSIGQKVWATHELISLFTFANDLGFPILRNAALDAFFLKIYNNPQNLPYRYIRRVYERTGEYSSLRHLMVDVVVGVGRERDVREWQDELPKTFLVDCLSGARREGVVPFAGGDVGEWLEGKRKKICGEDHLHDPGEGGEDEEMGGGGDGDDDIDQDEEDWDEEARAEQEAILKAMEQEGKERMKSLEEDMKRTRLRY